MNKISSLKDNQGNWIREEQEVADMVRNGFMNLFSTGFVSVPRKVWAISTWPKFLEAGEANTLNAEIIVQEMKDGLWSLKPLKAPGPDGFHASFFQVFWNIVGDSIVEEVKNIFSSSTMPRHLNETLITLIPKCPKADCLAAFKPISLCNTVYKVVTKIIVKRLRPLLSGLISPLQTAFVPGRLGMDNMIITQEIIHTMSKKKGKIGYMAIKIDLEKAYDRLEWHLIRDMLNLYCFP